MKKALITAAFIAVALAAYGLSGPASLAQETITGDWTAKVRQSDKGPRLWLTLTSSSENGKNRFNSSFELPLQDFSGLTTNAGSNAAFSLQREAGVVVFTGLFSDGKGVGEFRFTPNRGFVSALNGQGRDRVTTDELFAMTVHDVSTAFINELKSHGYDKVSVDNLIGMRIHRVDGKYIREMKEAGYNNLSIDDLIELRIHRVDAGSIKKMKGN